MHTGPVPTERESREVGLLTPTAGQRRVARGLGE
jgi:hypothetical protein